MFVFVGVRRISHCECISSFAASVQVCRCVLLPSGFSCSCVTRLVYTHTVASRTCWRDWEVLQLVVCGVTVAVTDQRLFRAEGGALPSPPPPPPSQPQARGRLRPAADNELFEYSKAQGECRADIVASEAAVCLCVCACANVRLFVC